MAAEPLAVAEVRQLLPVLIAVSVARGLDDGGLEPDSPLDPLIAAEVGAGDRARLPVPELEMGEVGAGVEQGRDFAGADMLRAELVVAVAGSDVLKNLAVEPCIDARTACVGRSCVAECLLADIGVTVDGADGVLKLAIQALLPMSAAVVHWRGVGPLRRQRPRLQETIRLRVTPHVDAASDTASATKPIGDVSDDGRGRSSAIQRASAILSGPEVPCSCQILHGFHHSTA
jgi:hypothetical protein